MTSPRPPLEMRIGKQTMVTAGTVDGVWIAYNVDWSGFALFQTEVEALRHAVTNYMNVGFAPWGKELGSGRYPETNRVSHVP